MSFIKKSIFGTCRDPWCYFVDNCCDRRLRTFVKIPSKKIHHMMFKRKGGGSKAFWTMLKKTALFLKGGFPNISYVHTITHCDSSFCPPVKNDNAKSDQFFTQPLLQKGSNIFLLQIFSNDKDQDKDTPPATWFSAHWYSYMLCVAWSGIRSP